MILIADSGSTKTTWCLVDHTLIVKVIHTKGINPYYQTSEEIQITLENELIPQLQCIMPTTIHFYGAGCASIEKNAVVISVLRIHFNSQIEVYNDLLGAARAVCGNQPGIACIMGTGSNSCFYDGKEIAENISPLGYILGDEGSGAALGKLFIGDCLKNQLPISVKDAFFTETELTPAHIIEQVYRMPFPNRFLASLAPFIARHLEVEEIHQLVFRSFKDFFIRNVMQYNYDLYEVCMIGSVAFHFKPVLQEVADLLNIRLGKIIQNPIDGLVAFHQHNQNTHTL